MWTPGLAEPVLIVDVVVASAEGLNAAGRYASQMGATRIAALVVAVLDDSTEAGEVGASFGPVMSLPRGLRVAA
jgi:hypothetical protein